MTTPPKKHVVEHGDTVSSIARRFGFSSFKTIWNHPENAALRAKRKNPNILNPGDELVIPERDLREEVRATDKLHRFEADRERLVLRVKAIDLNEDTIHGPFLYRDEFQSTLMAEKQDIQEVDIDPRVRNAEMRVSEAGKPPLEIALDVGGLNTVDDPEGQQDRLNNLGYFAGFSRKSVGTPQFQWAVEEFQCDQKLAVDGVCGTATQQQLAKRHGDV